MSYSNIDKPSKYFNTKLYTGNGSTQSITGVGFSPDWVWTKNRSTADSHELYDIVRGATKRLISHSTAAENTETYFSSFDSDGFTLSGNGNSNGNGNNIVAWCWDANGSGVSNTSGTISSTVSANTTSGFSIVSYTGNGTAGATVGHGLGVAPKMMIVKRRDGAVNWIVYHSGAGATKYLELNTTEVAQLQSSFNMFNSTAPTSSLFTLGNLSNTNGNTNTYIAYCFAEVKGFSKAFSYTGNGSADGTFIYTGMRPAFVLLKRTDSADNWVILDNKRDTFNLTYKVLKPDSSAVEDTNTGSTRANVDFLSNGFKLRQTSDIANASGGTYIGFAIAEQPFVSSKGIVANAR